MPETRTRLYPMKMGVGSNCTAGARMRVRFTIYLIDLLKLLADGHLT